MSTSGNDNKNNSSNNQASGTGGGSHPLSQYSVPNQPQQQEESPYFKSQAPSIAMPKGGGAIKGIDEKFSVNAVNGTAGLEIPLPLTPGRGGFTPALSLSYSSGSGNSEFGLGWGLSLPAIQRKTDRRLPQYNDASESDIFLLAGAEDLIPVLDEEGNREILQHNGYTIKRYRPRIEGLFARIEYITKDGFTGSWWRVITRENMTTYYGLSEESRITDPQYAHRIFKWLPDISIDHKGNVQLFTYKAEDTVNVPDSIFEKNRKNGLEPIANTYLKRVYYGNKTPYFVVPKDNDVLFPDMPKTDWMFEAVLDYGEHKDLTYEEKHDWMSRQDAFSGFHAGFEIRTYRKCKRVLMFHQFKELNAGMPTLVRSLDLQYEQDAADRPVETDYITQAQSTAYRLQTGGGYKSRSMPAMKLQYSKLKWNTRITKVSKEDFTGAPQGLTGPYQWIDFEGEGISGILTEQGTGWFYKNNLGNGHFAAPRSVALKPSFTGLGQQLQWQDLEGDGRRQVVDSTTAKGYWELDGPDADTEYTRKWAPFRTFEKKANIDWDSPFTKMLDLNGDGRADVLLTEDRAWSWWENEGKKGFDFGGMAPITTDEEKGPILLLRDRLQSIFLADMNGDGLTDLVRIRNGEVCYWPNKGYGKFGAKTAMANVPFFNSPDQFDPQYITLADISGTGAADIIYTGRNTCIAWINLSGNAFADAFEINPLPGTDQYSKLTVTDFLGNGTGCLVWSSPLPQHATAPIQYIDLMGGHKPHLLQKYYNGTGKSVWLQYKSSVQYYLEDKLKGIRWASRLPFPVHCVSKVTTYDLVSRSRFAQQYRYRHGYYDHEEREFRGFGYVETIDVDTVQWNNPVPEEAPESGSSSIGGSLNQHPVLTRTWYHTGAWMRESSLLREFKKEYYQFEGWDDFVQIASFPPSMNPQEQREAHRALKGSTLRQEIYALDGTDKEQIPYTVTATAYVVKKIQDTPSANTPDWKARKHASFISLQEQSVVFACERNPEDPRILQELVLETDAYGNVLQSASVAYARKEIPLSLPAIVQAEQAKVHISCTQATFTNDVIDNVELAYYRLRIGFEQQAYELGVFAPAAALYTPSELKVQLDTAAVIDFSITTAAEGEKRLLSHSRALFYNDDADTTLSAGTIESLAIPYESYTLAFTKKILDKSFGTRISDPMITEAGYVDLDTDENCWLPSGTVEYTTPKDHFYTPERYTDPWGNNTDIKYWNAYWLLPESATDAKGNTTAVRDYDWHTLQPLRLQDINDNITEALYDMLGMPVAMAIKGKDDGTEGDRLDDLDPDSTADKLEQAAFMEDPQAHAAALLKDATWRCVYDLESLPVSVAMIGREQHYYPVPSEDSEAPEAELLLQFTYSDGFGRVIMQKVQCEPVPGESLEEDSPELEWIGSGRTIYNNKGNAVMQFEPYFSTSHHCDTAEQAAAMGITPRLYYDPLDRNYKTQLPDGTFTKTIWTAWEQQVWDNNDTVLHSTWYWEREGGAMGAEEQEAAEQAALHADTPTVIHTDTLARGFYTIQYLSPITDTTPVTIHSFETLDIQGLRQSVTDGRGLVPLKYHYNMLQVPVYQQSIDSGKGRTFLDVTGQPLYSWDAEERRMEAGYDELRRPLYKKVQEGTLTKTLEVSVYGEGVVNDTIKNLRGQLLEHYDGSGRSVIEEGYDFKGNPIDPEMQLLLSPTLTDVDWSLSPALSPEVFITATVFDALNRPVQATDPGGNTHAYFYDKGGMLKSVQLNADNYVQDIHYDAKGQRQAIWYGNATKTKYEYDPLTFRLRRLLTTGNTGTNIYQDLHYWYDPAGNITQILDLAQQTLYFNNSVVAPTQRFTYDSLYRLTEARGRELKGTAAFGTKDNWNDNAWETSHKGDGNAVQNYIQQYTYDAVGNILQLQHIAATGSYTRSYEIDTASNRMLETQVGVNVYGYTYDARGNMEDMPHLDVLRWNLSNELSQIARGTNLTHYQYSGGQRIRKYTDKGSIKEERIYLGNFEIYRKFDGSSSLKVERQTVHVSDDAGRIAMLEKRTVGTAMDDHDTEAELVRYIYSNHLQSASLELDEHAAIISYEEYHPYGTTSYQAMNAAVKATAKRYRYTGKERDNESGLYYHGARYYIPWLCRWTAVDPMEAKYAGMSPYNYAFNNPVMYNDPSGMEGERFPLNPVIGYIHKTNDKNRYIYIGSDDGSDDGWAFYGELKEVFVYGKRSDNLSNVTLLPIMEIQTRDVTLQYYGDRPLNNFRRAKEARENTARAEWAKLSLQAFYNERFQGEQNGKFFDVSRGEVIINEYQLNQAWGNAVRGGLGGAIGSIIGGREGAFKGQVIDGLLMSYSSVGTPYGRVNSNNSIVLRDYGKATLVQKPLEFKTRTINATTGAQSVDNFISPHAYTRHKFDPSRTSSRSRTQYGQGIDVADIRNQTMNNADDIVPHYNENGVHYATTYKKTFSGQNISTSATPTSESRVIINHLDASKSTQFPYYRR